MPLKAYMVHNRHDGPDDTCFLVFAGSRGQARACVFEAYYYRFRGYLELRAVRRPAFDQYARKTERHIIETNNELPDGVKFYHEWG